VVDIHHYVHKLSCEQTDTQTDVQVITIPAMIEVHTSQDSGRQDQHQDSAKQDQDQDRDLDCSWLANTLTVI